METEDIELTRWLQVAIVCPHCGNHGATGGEWTKHSWTPFKLVEEVLRTFAFAARIDNDGQLMLTADVETDEVDWESANSVRFECMQCFGQFPVPEGSYIDFD